MSEESPDVGGISNWFGRNSIHAQKPGEIIGKVGWVGVVFAGSMAEVPFFNARSIVVNDKHLAVMNLAKIIASRPTQQELFRRIMDTPFHEAQLEESQAECKRFDDLYAPSDGVGLFLKEASTPCTLAPNLDWAYHYFNVSWMSRSGTAGTKGELRGAMSVRWEGSGGGSAKRYYSAARSLCQWRRAFRRCEFTAMDAFDFLDRALQSDKASYQRSLYLDPPFPGAGDAYKHSFPIDWHRRLRDSLIRFRNTKVVVRYYFTPLIEDLYRGFKFHRFEGRKQTNDAAPELLIEIN